MNKISKMSLKEILDITDLIMKPTDIVHFCHEEDVIKEFMKLDKGKGIDFREAKQFLLKYEDKIDKEKFVLVIARNYEENLEIINNVIKKEEDNIFQRVTVPNKEILREEREKLIEYTIQKDLQEKRLKNIKKIGKGLNKCVAIYFYDCNNNRYDIKIIDSKDVIDGVSSKKPQNLKRFKELDTELKRENSEENVGIECLLQSMVLTDLYEIFPDIYVGDYVRTMIIDNDIVEKGLMTKDEIEKMKHENYDKYEEFVTNTKFLGNVYELRKTLEKYIDHIDVDKLIMICCYRFEEGLENKAIDEKDIEGVKEILETSLKYVKEDKKTFELKLQSKKSGTYIEKNIKYSIKNIKNCINRIRNNKYLGIEEIKNIREKMTLGEINFYNIEQDDVDIIFSEKELGLLANLSDENLQYVAMKLRWDADKIIETIINKKGCSTSLLRDFITQKNIEANNIYKLYMNNAISIDQIKEIKKDIDLSEIVNPHELIQNYIHSIKKESKEENKEEYKKYLKLYKEVLINDNPEKLETITNDLMVEIVEQYDQNKQEEYLLQLKEFYKEGLLDIDVIVEWNNQDTTQKLITDLYKEQIINLEEIKQLIKDKKVPFECIKELVWGEDISYEKRMKVIKEGWVPEEEIFDLYRKTLIRDKDLLELADKSIISRSKVDNVINETNLADLEKNSKIVLRVNDTLQKIKRDKSLYETENEKKENKSQNKKPKLIIDPNERKEFFKLLGAGIPDEVEITNTSPFYNYEFYVIPDETGKINQNSVVIAERIYEEKEDNIKKDEGRKDKELRFATDNATYFFKYKDLMVLSNYLKKDEAVKEKKDIIFKANHTIATDEKNGHWAASVISGIAKTMLSSDLKEYSKENQRKIVVEKLNKVYGHDQLIKILDKGTKIDSGEYIGEIIENDTEGR